MEQYDQEWWESVSGVWFDSDNPDDWYAGCDETKIEEG